MIKILVDCRSIHPDKMGGIDHVANVIIKALLTIENIHLTLDVQKEFLSIYKDRYKNFKNIDFIYDPFVGFLRNIENRRIFPNILFVGANYFVKYFGEDFLNRRSGWQKNNDFDLIYYPYHLDRYLHKKNKYFVFIHAIFSYYDNKIIQIIHEHISKANSIIVGWPHPYKEIKKLAKNKEKVFNIPRYSDIESRSDDGTSEAFNFTEFLFYPSIISKRKNHELIIDAYNILIKRNVDVPIMVFSGGGENNELDNYLKNKCVDLNLDKKILFLGYLNNSQIFELYKKCIGTISASKEEAGYTTIIEGGAIGKPGLLIDNESSRSHAEFYNFKACFFDDDPEDLANKIIFFKDNLISFKKLAIETSDIIKSYDQSSVSKKLKNLVEYSLKQSQ